MGVLENGKQGPRLQLLTPCFKILLILFYLLSISLYYRFQLLTICKWLLHKENKLNYGLSSETGQMAQMFSHQAEGSHQPLISPQLSLSSRKRSLVLGNRSTDSEPHTVQSNQEYWKGKAEEKALFPSVQSWMILLFQIYFQKLDLTTFSKGSLILIFKLFTAITLFSPIHMYVQKQKHGLIYHT